MEKSKSSLLSSSIFCVRQMVLRVGFKFKLTIARVRTPAPSRLLMALLAGAGVQAAMALPQGGQVASGGVTIGTPANGSLNITQTTSKGVIDWQSFNVASGEKVNFLQPGATSSTLNRVIGSDPTSIFGQINANGQVFLVNNSGIYFAPGAQVNAAGLVASTLALSDADYLAGNYVLSGTGGTVDNQGALKAGFVALAGAQVSNTGTIVADGGTAALAAGGRVTLNLTGSDLVSVSVDAPLAAALVHSGGIVQADGGQVLISAKAADALLGTVVNVDGIVQAHSIGSRNGVITLDGGSSGVVSVSGKLDASGKGAGETGGTVKVLGADVGLFNGSIDASGDAGGGVVRVGGDWHGAGADGDANASQAIVDGTSSINANALTSGNGGNVVVWSDDHTQFSGTISARGGSTGGNGGQLETSAHDVLEAYGSVDLGAPKGSGGAWLIDPKDLTIVDSTSNTQSNIAATPGGTPDTFTSTGANARLLNSTISTALTAGATVNIDTSASTSGTNQNGNITVDAAVTASSLVSGDVATLNLNAIGNITFSANGSIKANVAGSSLNVNLNAGTSGAGSTGAGTNPSTITMDGAAAVDTGASGNFSATAQGDISLATLKVSGAATITSNGGAISEVAPTLANPNIDWSVGGLLWADAGNGGTVTITNANNDITAFKVSTSSGSAGAVDIQTGGGIALDAITATTLHVQAAGAVTQTGVITTSTSTSIDDSGATGTIALDTQANDFTQFSATTTDAAAFVHVTNPHDLALGNISTAALTVDTSGGASGVVTQAASTGLQVAGAVAITANATDDITVGSSGASNGSSIGSFGATGHDVSVTVGKAATDGIMLDNIAAHSLTTSTGANGSVTQNGGSSTITAATTSLGAGTGGVDIENTGNAIAQFGAISTGAVTYVAPAGAVDLGAVTGTSFNLTASGDITQTGGRITTTVGTTIVDNGANATVTLDTQPNSMTQLAATTTGTGAFVHVSNPHDLVLGDISTQSLSIDTTGGASGAVSQAGNTGLQVPGAVTITAGSGDDITVGSSGASHGSTIGSFGATGHDVSITVGKAAGDGIALDNIDANSLTTNTGATGAVSQTGGKTITATTTAFNAGSSGVDIANTGNTIGTWSGSTSGDVTFTSSGAMQLGNVSAGTLEVNAGGTVNQASGTALAVTNLANFQDASNTITLDKANSFGSVKATGGAVTIDATATTTTGLVLDDIVATSLSTATGSQGAVSQTAGKTISATTSASFGAGSGGVNVTNAGNVIGTWNANSSGDVALTSAGTMQLGTVSAGTLEVNASGAVTQTGAVVVTNAADIVASGFDITLNGSGNSFGSFGADGAAVNVKADKTAASGLLLDGINATSLTTATGTAGSVAQHGSATTITATTTSFGAGSGGVTIGNTGNAIGTWSSGTTGTTTFTSTGAVLLGGNAANALSVTAGGPITQTSGSPALAITTTSTLDAGANAVTLDNTANTFGGLVSATGTAVTLKDTGALAARLNSVASATLVATGALTVDGSAAGAIHATGTGVALGTAGHALGAGTTLDVVSNNGNITQGAAVSAGTTSSFDAGTGNVGLTTATNSFGGVVTATGTSVSVSATGALDANATLTGGSGDLSLIATGALTGPAAVTTSGNITLSSGAALNTGGALSGHDVSLTGMSVGIGHDVTAGGNLTLHATAGDVTQTAGTVAATGTSSLTATGGAVDVSKSTNDFGGAVTASGNTVALSDTNALTAHVTTATGAATLTASGLLTVDGSTATDLNTTSVGLAFGSAGTTVNGNLLAGAGSGAITQSGALAVTGTSGLTASGAVTLADGVDNSFGGLVTASGSSLDIEAKTSLDIAPTLGSGSGSLILVANGSGSTLTLNGIGNISTTGDVTLSAGAGLTTSGNITARNVSLGGGAIDIENAITASGTFAATSSSTITEGAGGSVTATAGAATVNAGSHAVDLGGANDFSTLTVTGGAVTVNDINALTAHVTSTGGASLTAGSANALTVDGTVSGGALALNAGSIVLGSSSSSTTGVTGNLTATASSGSISQAAALTVTGTSSLDAGSNAVTLGTGTNDFGGLVSVNGGAVTLQDTNALSVHLGTVGSADLTAGGTLAVDGATTGNLGASGNGVSFGITTVGGTLTAAGGTGVVSQTGKISVAGTSDIGTTGGSVLLADTTNAFQSAVTLSGPTVTLVNGGALTAHVTSANNATVTSSTGSLTVDGTTTNNLTATGVGVSFGNTTVGGALLATSSGTIGETGALSVTGTTGLSAGGNAVTLTGANDFGGTVTVQGGAVQLHDTNALSVALTGASSATLTAGGLLTAAGTSTGDLDLTGTGVAFGAGITSVGGTLTANSGSGPITQNASSTIQAGNASLGAGGSAITLTNATNDFGTVSATGGAVSLTDANAMTVHLASAASGSLVAGGTLTVDGATTGALAATGDGIVFGATNVGTTLAATTTGGGNVSQTGALVVGTTSTLDAGTGSIDFGSLTTNDFGGAVTATGASVSLADANALAVHLASVGSATLSAGTQLAVDGAATGALTASGNGVDFTAAGTTVGGALTVHSGTGTISQGGSLVVTGTSLLDAGTSNIALQDGGNAFAGLVTVDGGTVALSDTGPLAVHLGTVNNANLDSSGALAVDGATTAGLTVAGNGVSFGATSVGGALDASTTGAGTISQTGQLAVAGTSTLNAGANAINLGTVATNDFGGAVTATGGAVTLTDANALTAHVIANSAALTAGGVLTVDGHTSGALQATGDGVAFGAAGTVVGGALTATGTGGGTITQSGSLQVAGASTLDAGTSAITLAAPGDHFAGLVTATGGAVTLSDNGDIAVHLANAASGNVTALGGVTVDGTTTGDLTAGGASVSFGAAGTTVGGSLGATASTGDITQAGAVTVALDSTLTATAGAIALANGGNDFYTVTANAAGGVSLTDANGLVAHVTAAGATLQASVLTLDGDITGNLQTTNQGLIFGPGGTTVGGALVGNTGPVSQTGSVVVDGTTTLNTNGNSVMLNNAANDFVGAVSVSGGGVSFADANALTIHLNTGVANLSAGGVLTLDGAATAVDATGTSVVFGTGSMLATSSLQAHATSGTISQSGALAVHGAALLDAGTGDVTLQNSGNDFTGLVTADGGTVALSGAGPLAVHLGTVNNANLAATSALTVDGNTTAGLTVAGNGVSFGTTAVGGTLAATSGTGSISQTGALTVAGATTLDAGSNAITLGTTTNDFTGAVTAAGGAVTIADANALTAHVTAGSATLGAGGLLTVSGSTSGALDITGQGLSIGATTVQGALTGASTGSVTQTGDLAVTGAATISAAGQAVTLARSTNALDGGVTVTAANADIEQAGALAAHLSNVGSATLVSGAGLTVDGTSTGNVTANGSNVTFGSGATSIGGTLAATSGAGDITQAGSLAVTGTSTLNAGTGNVTLASAGNALAGAVTATGAAVTLTDASALTAHVSANGAATLTSSNGLTVDGTSGAMTLSGSAVNFGAAGTTVNGALDATGTSIGQAGALTVTGLSNLNAGSGDILLDSPGANLQGAITATGHVIHLTDSSAIDANLTAGGDVVLSSTADVTAHGTFHGGLKISGAHVSLDQGSSGSPLSVANQLDVTSTGDTSLGYVDAGGASVSAGGAVLLEGTLKSSGDVTLKGQQIQGVNRLGALDVAGGSTLSLDTTGTGGGNIGKGATTAANLVDDQAIISLLGTTGQTAMYIAFNPGQSAWFRVASQAQTNLIQAHQDETLRGQTFFCDTTTCVNKLGQTTVIADTVVSNILSAAAQDAADAAFGTENLDFAIRRGYVTTIGRVPPGIDEIAGDLGATQCDSRVTSAGSIAASGGCGSASPKGGPRHNPLDKGELPKN